ncbi:hypothetical protein P8C59_006821 [Phyllachora maydis]|uniref:Mitochondrial import inner membrane translocase subunit n=1 Tax=Phyllachora maydis TaxID=1825666 RepID=A0AAD9I729_9PEZI|nr:hypothetical protein P8C59_006821 [Phyllachora maydis]
MDMGLTANEQRDLEQRLQRKQMKEFMTVYANLVDHCFVSCIDDFTSKALSGRENGCVSRCVLKSMAGGQRLSERFAEQNMAAMQQNQQQK